MSATILAHLHISTILHPNRPGSYKKKVSICVMKTGLLLLVCLLDLFMLR